MLLQAANALLKEQPQIRGLEEVESDSPIGDTSGRRVLVVAEFSVVYKRLGFPPALVGPHALGDLPAKRQRPQRGEL
jgi:hypothetical protein